MRVLMTGATGFVGSKLVQVLDDRGFLVTAVSRNSPPIQPEVYTHKILDIAPQTVWNPLLENLHALIHLADGYNAFEKLPASSQNERAMERLEATLNLVSAAVEGGVPHFVYLSTIKAMCGTWAENILTENTAPNPQSLYGRLKLETEHRITRMAEGTDTRVTILRFPIVFGTGVGGNFSRLLSLVDTPWPLPFAGLKTRRSMVSLTSLTDAIVRVVEDKVAGGGTFLVCDGAVTMAQMTTQLRSGLGRPARLYKVPGLAWEFVKFLPKIGEKFDRFSRPLEVSNAEFRKRFSWIPPIEIQDELRRSAEDYRHSKY